MEGVYLSAPCANGLAGALACGYTINLHGRADKNQPSRQDPCRRQRTDWTEWPLRIAHRTNEGGLIFSVLGILIWMAATTCVSEIIPGSRRRVAPGALLGAGSLALLAVFAVLFHDYRTGHFVSQGVVCLTAGLLHAIPAALASWLLLRRGFAVNSVAAGLVMGTLAGLAGVTMLELHCANLQAPHVMLWHTAVMPVSAAAGVAGVVVPFPGPHERS